LEQALGKPVLTSNQALAWLCQRRGGINQSVHGFGELLASTKAVQADAIQPAANVG
jgi:maleate cis-trans isomerase